MNDIFVLSVFVFCIMCLIYTINAHKKNKAKWKTLAVKIYTKECQKSCTLKRDEDYCIHCINTNKLKNRYPQGKI